MPSAPRDLAPGVHHVWVSATGGEKYFRDGEDRITWVRYLVKTLDDFDWTCLAFCQMTTHVHVLVDVPDQSLPLGMKSLNLSYSTDFNARHDRVGQFVRRRYGSRRIVDGPDLLVVYAYVVRNAEVAGMCRDSIDWRWSSYPTTIGISNDFPFVNASLAIADAGGTVARLRQFVDSRTAAQLAKAATSGV